MKNLIKSLRFTLVFCVFISISYIFVLWLYARITGSNNAETVTLNGKVVGAANVGQMFTQDIYFGDVPLRLVTDTTHRVRPVATRALRMRSTWPR